MGPNQGILPDPVQDEVVWLDDIDAAMKEARAKNRPMFITFRGPPCDQCSYFDALVLLGSTQLTPLYRQFITARITNAREIDHRIFKFTEFQDLDLSWWGYFLSPEGKIYGVYGGKDHVSDKTRISEMGLVKAMQRILAHHYDPRRKDWDIDGPLPDLSGSPQLPEDLPGAKSYFRNHKRVKEQACLHCHQVNNIIYTGKIEAGAFDKTKDATPWPLPENIGITLDLDDGLLVTKVETNSPAEKAGFQAGDRLVVADERKLFSQTDFRAVLHRASGDPTTIAIYYNRDNKPAYALVQTNKAWKQTINFWRKSIYDGVIGATPGFFPLKGPNQGKGVLSLKPFVKGKQNHPSYKSGIRPNQEIIAVDGMQKDIETREFLTWFRMNYESGDVVKITVKENGETKEISYRLPRK